MTCSLYVPICGVKSPQPEKITTMQNPNIQTTPNSIPWPPILYIMTGLLGLYLSYTSALPILPEGAARYALATIGLFIGATAIAFDLAIIRLFRKSKTTILPHRGATNLITTGPFAWSRNPIYLGNTCILIAAGLVMNSIWLVGLSLIAAALTQHLAIKPEERHLQAKFGAEWDAYASKVKRWIGRR